MHNFETVLGLLVAVVVLVNFAGKINVPYPIVLVLGGLMLGFVPGLPDVKLAPELVFVLFLPPLLYAEASLTSWRDFLKNLRAITLLSIALVLTTTLTVAGVAHLMIPGIPWAACFVLGAIVAPTDAVAFASIAERLSVPRRVVSVLSGESLVNDATALVIYRLASVAVVSGTFSLGAAGAQFVLVSVGGVLIGLALAWLATRIFVKLDDAPSQVAATLLIPFVGYLTAEHYHVSGVLAVVASGIYIGRQTSRRISSNARLQGKAFWQMLVFLLNGFLFVLVGLQLRHILQALTEYPVGTLIKDGAIISVAVIVTRVIWVFPAAYLPRLLSKKIREREPMPHWTQVAIVAWTGIRGGISLAAALAIPLIGQGGAPFPGRNLFIFLTFSVILATLVLQGLSLPWLIEKLGVRDDGAAGREEAHARLEASKAALRHLDTANEKLPGPVLDNLKNRYQHKTDHFAGRVDGSSSEDHEATVRAMTDLQRAIVTEQRRVVVKLRDNGDISDEVMHRIERDLDLEEERLA